MWLPAVLAVLVFAPTAAADALIEYRVQGDAIPKPLTDRPGVAERGRAVVLDPERGNCVICHPMPIDEMAFQGDVGPDLAGVGARYGKGELRLRVVDPRHLNPRTVMPSYYRIEELHRVMDRYRGRPILTPQEVEDVVAYLKTLREE